MKPLARHPRRSSRLALIAFLLAYGAALALVIAPDQVKAAFDAPWPFG